MKEFKYLRVLFTSDGTMQHEIDSRIGAASAAVWGIVMDHNGEEGAEPENKALHLPVNLHSNPQLWS